MSDRNRAKLAEEMEHKLASIIHDITKVRDKYPFLEVDQILDGLMLMQGQLVNLPTPLCTQIIFMGKYKYYFLLTLAAEYGEELKKGEPEEQRASEIIMNVTSRLASNIMEAKVNEKSSFRELFLLFKASCSKHITPKEELTMENFRFLFDIINKAVADMLEFQRNYNKQFGGRTGAKPKIPAKKMTSVDKFLTLVDVKEQKAGEGEKQKKPKHTKPSDRSQRPGKQDKEDQQKPSKKGDKGVPTDKDPKKNISSKESSQPALGAGREKKPTVQPQPEDAGKKQSTSSTNNEVIALPSTSKVSDKDKTVSVSGQNPLENLTASQINKIDFIGAAKNTMKSDLPIWDSWEQMEKELDQLVDTSLWEAQFTKVKTLYNGCEMIGSYLDEITKATSSAAKSGIVSRYLTKNLKGMMPLYQCAWMLNLRIWELSTEFFKTEMGINMITLFKKTSKESEVEFECIQMYNKCCLEFREMARDFLGKANSAFRTAEENINLTIIVSKSLMTYVNLILQSINAKRNANLGIQSGTNNRNEAGEPNHYDFYVDFLETGVHMSHMDLGARRASGQGLTLLPGPEITFPIYNPKGGKKELKKGALLLTTALIYHRNKIGDPDYCPPRPANGRDAAYLAIALQEAKQSETDPRILGSIGQSSQYRQQFSNIDIVFNFHLWCHAVGITTKDLKFVNIFLYLAGQNLVGRDKVYSLLKNCPNPLKQLLDFDNSTGSMYMAPYAFTCGRFYDMVAVYGGIRWGKLADSIKKPGVSERYLTHLRTESSVGLEFATNYWLLETTANPSSRIMASEHCFHQILINKVSAYENSISKEGNVFGITFRAIEDDYRPYDKQLKSLVRTQPSKEALEEQKYQEERVTYLTGLMSFMSDEFIYGLVHELANIHTAKGLGLEQPKTVNFVKGGLQSIGVHEEDLYEVGVKQLADRLQFIKEQCQHFNVPCSYNVSDIKDIYLDAMRHHRSEIQFKLDIEQAEYESYFENILGAEVDEDSLEEAIAAAAENASKKTEVIANVEVKDPLPSEGQKNNSEGQDDKEGIAAEKGEDDQEALESETPTDEFAGLDSEKLAQLFSPESK